MSKSYNNCIYLSDDEKTLKEKVRQMFTDPKKIRKNDLGHPDGCVVFAFHKIFSQDYTEIEKDCRAGTIGCVDCKNKITGQLNILLNPIRARRNDYLSKKEIVDEVLVAGAKKAHETAEKTMAEIRTNMGFKIL
jgi:tryptophanyl-tRNA synthetase